VKTALEKVLEDLGGIHSFVKRGDRVLLKPNLLWGAPSQAAVVTHPAFVEALATMIVDSGATPFIGDSSSIGGLARTLAKSGYDPFMKRMGIQAVPFKETASVEAPEGRVFRRIDLAREVFGFDRLINLAKLKTHCQMVLTLAVKNLFGTIAGADKAMWHLKAGKDYDTFATVLVQILESVKPTLSLLDGILGMEGDGPSAGKPRYIGIIAASTDALALDATVCRLLGFRVESVRTCVIGESLGVGVTAKDRIEIAGDALEGFPMRDFKPPKSMTITWNLPSGNFARRLLEHFLITKPAIDESDCAGCWNCLDHCPPAAISEKNGKMVIDYAKCISCFCCQEICPNKAVRVVQPRLGRLLSKISRS
jgi:uncharacterized protein (DUF362 family)/NAD-dependent dihydropyrimidine dehydrogenase PreA subunit